MVSGSRGHGDGAETRALQRATPSLEALEWVVAVAGARSVEAVEPMPGGGSLAMHRVTVSFVDGGSARLVLRRFVRPDQIAEDPAVAGHEAGGVGTRRTDRYTDTAADRRRRQRRAGRHTSVVDDRAPREAGLDAFDPNIAARFSLAAGDILDGLGDASTWDEVIAAEPVLVRPLRGAEFDEALGAVADFVDLESLYTLRASGSGSASSPTSRSGCCSSPRR